MHLQIFVASTYQEKKVFNTFSMVNKSFSFRLLYKYETIHVHLRSPDLIMGTNFYHVTLDKLKAKCCDILNIL